MLARILPLIPALLALAVFTLNGNVWLGYALSLTTFAYIWRHLSLDRLGNNRIARIVVVCGLMVAEVRLDEQVLIVLSALVLIGLAHQEGTVRSVVQRVRLPSANLAVRRPRYERWLDVRYVNLVIAILSLGMLATVAFRLSPIPLAIGCFGLAAIIAGLGMRMILRKDDDEDHDTYRAVEELAPKFAIHFSAPANSEYQLLMWLPYFDRLGEPYLVVLRERAMLNVVAQATTAPTVVVRKISELEDVLVDSVRSVFYVNNGMKNTHCVRLAHLTHVQLLHGDSDKASSYSQVTGMFDQIFVAGQAGIDRYARNGVDIPGKHFRIVGRPQIADVVPGPGAAKDAPTVLYAPTWTGYSTDVNYASLPIGDKIVSALLGAGATVILRHHPYTGRNRIAAAQLARLQSKLAADAEASGRAHKWGTAAAEEMSFVDCINQADAMICDVSGVAADWLYSEKPFATTDMQDEGEAFHASFPLSQASYVVSADGSNIETVVAEMLGDDPLADDRQQMKAYYLGGIEPDHYVERFLDAARATYEAQPFEERPSVPGAADPQLQ